jgi:hypothetical protein
MAQHQPTGRAGARLSWRAVADCAVAFSRQLSWNGARMKTPSAKSLLLAVLLLGTLPAPAVAAQSAAGPAPYNDRMTWWGDARFGLFIHWGPVSLKGTEIGWSRGGDRRGYGSQGNQVPAAVYDNLYKEFNPTNFNAREWVDRRQGRRHEIPRLHQPSPRRLQHVRHPGQRLQDHPP